MRLKLIHNLDSEERKRAGDEAILKFLETEADALEQYYILKLLEKQADAFEVLERFDASMKVRKIIYYTSNRLYGEMDWKTLTAKNKLTRLLGSESKI